MHASLVMAVIISLQNVVFEDEAHLEKLIPKYRTPKKRSRFDIYHFSKLA